jgi:hypothetical protein
MCSMHFDDGVRCLGPLEMVSSGRVAVPIPAKRYRIGEVVRCSPFSRQTIHNYTIMGLIREAEWTEGGHRLYDETVFERLSRIVELRKTKSLAEIRHILREEEGVVASGSGLGGNTGHLAI